MPYRIAAQNSGPLAELAESLAFPATLQLTAQVEHHLWTLTDPFLPKGCQTAWVFIPANSATDPAPIQFDSVDDWRPGMIVVFERRGAIRSRVAAEISALWTSIAAPLKTALIGDIGLDLDLGIRAEADWLANSDSWWSVARPTEAPALRVRLCSSAASIRSIQVKGGAVAGLDQATRNSIAAILGRHRTQLLQQLRRTAGAEVRNFLDKWLNLPASVQSEQWRSPSDPILAGLKAAVESSVDTAIDQADQVTARIEYAAVRAMESHVEGTLAAVLTKVESDSALLDAEFDFSVNPDLMPSFLQALDGDLNGLLTAPVQGLTLYYGAVSHDLNKRRTFAWRLPFSSGSATSRERLQTAMEALDDATGRVAKLFTRATAERRTRHAASLLSIEGTFAAHLGGEITVYDPPSLNAHFELDLRANRPASLQPLLDLYNAGHAQKGAKRCRLELTLPPDAIASWFAPQDPNEVSRRMQSGWRTLLPAATNIDDLDVRVAAPLLVWASLPVSTAVRRTSEGFELNRPNGAYWDWANPDLLQAMVWHPRTRTALENRLAQTRFDATPDELRRIVGQSPAAAVFQSLVRTEASFIGRLTSLLERYAATPGDATEHMRNLSLLLSGLTCYFHEKLASVYGAETARAIGPMLLCATSDVKPEAKVTWSR